MSLCLQILAMFCRHVERVIRVWLVWVFSPFVFPREASRDERNTEGTRFISLIILSIPYKRPFNA